MESGGTKLLTALADGEDRLQEVRRSYRRPGQRAAQTLEQLIRMGRELTAGNQPQAVCLGFGGTVRKSDGKPLACFHEEGWGELDTPALLREAFGVDVFVENDCNLAALGEAHCGAGQTRGTVFYATLGTGIGAGIVGEGALLALGDTGEAEIGHIVVDKEGSSCPCGNRGCLETVASGPGLARLARDMVGWEGDAQTLMEAFREGDSRAGAVIAHAADHLGRVFGTVINLLHPQVIVLGGGVMKGNQAFLERIQAATRPWVFPLFAGSTRFTLSGLGEQVVCQGAAVYARQRLLLRNGSAHST
jgi:glucokinase